MGKKISLGWLFPAGLVGVIMLAGAFLTLPVVQADDDTSISTATITVPISCSMIGVTDTVHTAEIPNGIDSRSSGYYPNGIGKTTLKAYCNDNGGFAIYAVGFSDDTIGNTYLRDNALGQTADIQTGITFSGNTSAWGMRLGTQKDSGDTSGTNALTIDSDANGSFASSNYHVVPSVYTKVAHKNTSTNMDLTNGGAELTTTYAAYISPTQKSGTYIGQVKYTLVHPASAWEPSPEITEAGCIRYYPNGSNVEGTMGCQEINSSDTSATLLASNFSREGYGFAGWSTTYNYSDSTGFLGPQEYITFIAGQYTGSNNGLSLYARWIKSAGNLQGWTGCSSLASSAVTALTDQRDGETYAVAKLADGNCWMIENLRLESTASHNSDGMLAQGYGTSATYGNFSGLADAETADKFTSTYSANSLYSNDGSNDTINIGSSNAAYRMPRYNNVNTPTIAADRPSEPTSNSATNSTSNAGMYSYGNYYTWAAAIADTTAYTTNNQSVASTSICPSGWHLPKGGDKANEANNEFWSLVVTGINNGTSPANYDSSTQPYYYDTSEAGLVANALRAYPNNFVYSGTVESSSVSFRGNRGLYWSSTAYEHRYAYVLRLSSGIVYPGTNTYYKYTGITIRCIASGA